MFSCCWEIIFPVWGWIAVLNENKASAVYSANMKLVSTELGKNSGKIVENSSMRKGGGGQLCEVFYYKNTIIYLK